MSRERINARAEDFLDREERERHARKLDEPSGWDGALAVVNVGTSLLPGLGPAIGAVLTEVVPRRRDRRRVQLLRELERAVARLQDRIDVELVSREEFADLAEEIVGQIERRESEGKQRYYAAAMANSLTPEAPAAIDQAKMIAALSDLRPLHLRMIAVLHTEFATPDEVGRGNKATLALRRLLPGPTQEQIENHYLELQQHGIVPTFAQRARSGDPRVLSGDLTPFGRRFAHWISAG
jgi:hypothetical protein